MNIGKIRLSHELLLKWLDYSGGIIRAVENDETLGFSVITIEHPDMPDVRPGEYILVVEPAYLVYEDALGNKAFVREKTKGERGIRH